MAFGGSNNTSLHRTMGDQQKPVILIVHGAWHRPWHYRALINDFRAKGYTVAAPTLVSSGEDDSIVTKTYHDVPTKLDPNGRPIRIFVIAPKVPGYPDAKFPGMVHAAWIQCCICLM